MTVLLCSQSCSNALLRPGTNTYQHFVNTAFKSLFYSDNTVIKASNCILYIL